MKPILFSTPMVKAIVAGHKTMTRRVIDINISDHFDIDVDGSAIAYIAPDTGDHYRPEEVARYRPGDILWVRETWGDYDGEAGYYEYRANYPDGAETYEWPEPDEFGDKIICDLPKWKPSIHMPKEAARIFLRVTEVRAERLQDIGVNDAKREGVFHACNMCSHWHDYCGQQVVLARDCKIDGIAPEFPELWDSLNAKRGYSWATNPWVWVYTFERCEKPGGAE